MAIKRVYGVIDGKDEITFNYNKVSGKYDIVLPTYITFNCVIDIYAEDIAGNISFFCAYLCTFDPQKMQMKMEKIDYIAKLESDETDSMMVNDGLQGDVFMNEQKYQASIVEEPDEDTLEYEFDIKLLNAEYEVSLV